MYWRNWNDGPPTHDSFNGSLGSSMDGVYGDYVVVDQSALVPMPAGLSFEEAAALPTAGLTAWSAVMVEGHAGPGRTVLVQGTGGVSTFALVLAHAAGAKVIVTSSSDEKLQRARQLGADETINYSRGQLREELKALTQGKGPDVVYDPVGGDLAEPVFRSIAWRGRYLVIGFAQGGIPALPLNLALLKGASIVGVFWGEFARREPKNNARALAELAGWYAQGKIKPAIDRTLPMSALSDAFTRMGSRQVQGKIVLVNR
jgi:NADPH2:quinone reductase